MASAPGPVPGTPMSTPRLATMTDSRHPVAQRFFGLYRGIVINNVDPLRNERVQAEVPAVAPGTMGWAPVIGGRHLDVGDTVFVSFEGGDVNYPVVLGPVGGSPNGPVLPTGSTLVVDEATGTIELRHGTGTVVSIGPSGKVRIESVSGVDIVAPIVDIESALVKVTGVLRTQTLVADSVVSASYTPGVGNIW